MFSPVILDFLKSAALPAAVASVLLFLVGGMRDPMRARLQATIWATAFVGGCMVLVSRLNFPPTDVNEGFSWIAILLALFIWISPVAVGSRYLLRALFVVAIGLLSLWQIRSSLGGYVHQRNMLAFFFLGLGTWSIVERSSQKVQTLTLMTLPMISATALSLILLFKGSAVLSQILSVACTLYGGVFAISLVAPAKISKAAVLPFVSIFLISFMAIGHFYLDINPWTMIYLCLPFLVLWIRNWIPFVPRQPIAEAVVLGAVSAIPLGYMVWNIYQTSGPLF